ncbi:hypothetical protein U9M48_000912 [Paspalum notatum var. saurae]|uniref:Uncharacterized protein n=1 Tax=Paspalum notatum var. saurae TaxID=547442 RepID=A0AAQ3PED8_PASNO
MMSEVGGLVRAAEAAEDSDGTDIEERLAPGPSMATGQRRRGASWSGEALDGDAQATLGTVGGSGGSGGVVVARRMGPRKCGGAARQWGRATTARTRWRAAQRSALWAAGCERGRGTAGRQQLARLFFCFLIN